MRAEMAMVHKRRWLACVLTGLTLGCSEAAPPSTAATDTDTASTPLFDSSQSKLDGGGKGDGTKTDSVAAETTEGTGLAADSGSGASDSSSGSSSDALPDSKADGSSIVVGCDNDGDCSTGNPCSVGSCDLTSHTCVTVAKAGCCTFGSCCDLAKGTVMAAGSPCGTQVMATEWACNGNQLQFRSATAGCSGAGPDACSDAPADWVWSPWATDQVCSGSCEVKDKSQPGQCVGGSSNPPPPPPGKCAAGSQCCEADGQPSPQGKACGSFPLATQYQCDGNQVMTRSAVAGCAGATASCSYTAANYAWSPWSVYKSCGVGEVCVASSPTTPGSCKLATACKAGSSCCDASGNWQAKGSLCGSSTATQWQCQGNEVQVRKQFGTCQGSSATCASWTTAWTAWTTVSSCGDSATCTAATWGNDPPTCQTKAVDACTAADPWESGTSTETAVVLGSHKDSAPALWLDPPVRLGTPSDKDFFRHTINDASGFDSPAVDLSWSAAQPVTVCAWSRCTAGKNGTDCAAIQCPFGSTQTSNPAVSAVAANGCCSTKASGSLSWWPKAQGSQDNSVEVFWSVENKGAACQEVKLKRSFGGASWTVCEPGATCCAPSGTYASAGTACGSPQKTEYRCAVTASGTAIAEKRTAQASCDGTTSFCSSKNALVWGPWQADKVCLGAEVCASALPANPAYCVVPPPGSCAGACGGKSKDGTCYCDSQCGAGGDCCKDFTALCGGSCANACGGPSASGGCQCDSQCSTQGTCCFDKTSLCP